MRHIVSESGASSKNGIAGALQHLVPFVCHENNGGRCNQLCWSLGQAHCSSSVAKGDENEEQLLHFKETPKGKCKKKQQQLRSFCASLQWFWLFICDFSCMHLVSYVQSHVSVLVRLMYQIKLVTKIYDLVTTGKFSHWSPAGSWTISSPFRTRNEERIKEDDMAIVITGFFLRPLLLAICANLVQVFKCFMKLYSSPLSGTLNFSLWIAKVLVLQIEVLLVAAR